MSSPTPSKRWFSITEVKAESVSDAPPAGEALAESVRLIEDKLVAESRSSNWTTWTTGMPPDGHPDAGYEIDF